jgi:hypothetical protein
LGSSSLQPGDANSAIRPNAKNMVFFMVLGF